MHNMDDYIAMSLPKLLSFISHLQKERTLEIFVKHISEQKKQSARKYRMDFFLCSKVSQYEYIYIYSHPLVIITVILILIFYKWNIKLTLFFALVEFLPGLHPLSNSTRVTNSLAQNCFSGVGILTRWNNNDHKFSWLITSAHLL